MNLKSWMTVMVIALGAIAGVNAQEKPAVPADGSGYVPLEVRLVVTRMQGQKKVSSVPYSLAVVANDGNRSTLNMGVDMPVPTGSGSHSLRSVGTTIDCIARTSAPGLYRLALTVSDSSIATAGERVQNVAFSGVPNVPSMRSFKSTLNLLLRDGQTARHTSATDPVTGELLQVDVTAVVLK